MVVKTFRGLLADGGQDQIRLQTIKGKVGYRILKLQVISNNPGVDTVEGIVKIYKSSQSTIDGVVDFTDSDLMAVAEYHKEQNSAYPLTLNIVFDSEIVNQDIYVTYKDILTGVAMNYYFELEVIPLDDAGAEYTTLKDMRQA